MKWLLSPFVRFCVVVGVGAAVVSGASAAGRDVPVRCGQMIEHSVVLHASLLCRTSPNGAALNVVGDGVTVDLNGYMITGGDTIASLDGISILGANAVIKNGTVKSFSDGIITAPCARGSATLLNMTLTRNGVGLEGDLLPGCFSFVFNVSGSTFSFNREGAGLTLWGLDVAGSLFTNNQVGIAMASAGCICDQDRFVANGSAAIVAGDSLVQLSNSELSGSGGDGLLLSASTCVCDHDRIVGNQGNGITADYSLYGYNSPLQVTNSTVSSNAGTGLQLFSTNCVCDRNTILRNGGAGVYAYRSSLQFTNNWVGRNGLDGVLAADQPGTSQHYLFAGNTANENGGHGIVAPLNAIDQGGNKARLNALSPQCVNIVCAS